MIILLLLGLVGTYLFFCLRTKINTSFFGIIYTSATSVILYLFALCNFLRVGLYILLGLELALLVYSLFLVFLKHENPLERINMVSVIFVAVSAIWLFAITRNVGLSQWDDMNHWYRICKILNSENALPTTPDIMFPSYVPGTAVWIYYLTRFIGFSVPNCFFAHSLLNVLGISSLLCYSKSKKDYWLILLISIVGIVTCALDVSTYALLVDTIIGIIPFAALCILFYHKDDKTPEKYVFIGILLCFESLIKTSGSFFALMVCLAPLFMHGITKKEKITMFISGLAIPMALGYSYVIRANVVYGGIAGSKQGVSVKRYASFLSGRSFKDVANVGKKMCDELFNLGNATKQVQFIWLCVVLLIVVGAFVKAKGYFCGEKFGVPYILTCLVLYSLGLFAVYVCSMESYEANADYLAVFFRYIGSFSIFAFGITVICLLDMFKESKWPYEQLMFAAIIVISLIVRLDFGYIIGERYYNPEEPYTTAIWDAFVECVPENQEYNENSYVLVWDYNQFAGDFSTDKIIELTETYFRTKNYKIISLQDVVDGNYSDEFGEICANSDYFVTIGDYSANEEQLKKLADFDSYHPGVMEIIH